MNLIKKRFNITLVFIFTQLALAAAAMLILDRFINKKNSFYINLMFYLVLLIAPVFIYIWKVLRYNPFKYMRLGKNAAAGIFKGILAGLLIALIFLIKNKFKINFNTIALSELVGPFLAGLFEEIPFRGFYLRFFKSHYKFWMANIITSVLFAVIHLKYIMTGNFVQIIMLFIISMWLGYINEKFRSLWSPVLVHGIYNIITILF